MTDDDDTPERKATWREHAVEWAKTIAGAFLAYLAFTTVAFANYRIPSESMVPHLEVGDRVIVSKFAYGYSRFSLPLNIGFMLPRSQHRFLENLPRRGDVVVFIHPRTGETIIKRAIGLPGDTIQVRDGALWINGEAAVTTEPEMLIRERHGRDGTGRETAYRSEEQLPNGYRHATHNIAPGEPLDEFGPFVVPEGHIFFMGDNRDRSGDSRTPEMGAVPIEYLVGRAEVVYATRSCGRNPTVSCPMDRWMKPLHH
jgi:signal peptidase I